MQMFQTGNLPKTTQKKQNKAKWNSMYNQYHRMVPCNARAISKDGKSTEAEKTDLDIWEERAGVKKSRIKMQMIDKREKNRGMVATGNIPEQSTIMQLGRLQTLEVCQQSSNPFPKKLDNTFWEQAPWYQRLALKLIAEKKKGALSPLQLWIGQLPKKFFNIPTWSTDELALIKYPYVQQMARDQVALYSSLYDELEANMSNGLEISFKEFKWALDNVLTRNHSGPYIQSNSFTRAVIVIVFLLLGIANIEIFHNPEEITIRLVGLCIIMYFTTESALSRQQKVHALLPLIDYFNHNYKTKCEVQYEYLYDRYVVTTDREWKKGEEVFITYGDLDNDKLLRSYGFVLRDNPFDVYVIADFLPKLQAAVGYPEERAAKLDKAGRLEHVQCLRVGRGGKLTTNGQAALRYLLAPPAKGGKELKIKDFESKQSDELETKLFASLLKVGQQELSIIKDDIGQMPTPDAQSAAAAGSKNAGDGKSKGFGSTYSTDVKKSKRVGNVSPSRRDMADVFNAEKVAVLSRCVKVWGRRVESKNSVELEGGLPEEEKV